MKQVRIGNKFIGDGCPCFISLEPSAAYTDFRTAKDLLLGIAGTGADAVKFQTFLPDDAVTSVEFFQTWAVDEIIILDVTRQEVTKEKFF